MLSACTICQNTEHNKNYIVREMMFGLRTPFNYTKCAECGCMQLENKPSDMAPYYPSEQYYSFHTSSLSPVKTFFKNYILGKLFNYYLGHFSFVGFIASRFYYLQKKYGWIECLKGIDKSATILDIGSGAGKYLDELKQAGFEKITGIDPYIEADITTSLGVSIFKKQIAAVTGKYDFIMLNHAFEHMDHPREILQNIHGLLNPNGQLLIRIPVIDCYSWEKYGVNWFQIDAPRHLYLHTKKSMDILAKQTSFAIQSIVYDSNDYQFIFSEKYVLDKTLIEPFSFPKKSIQDWRKMAKALNKKKQGDQACFILKPAPPND